MRDVAEVASQSHKLEVGGSNPSPASKCLRKYAGVMKLVDFRSLEVRVRKSVLVRVQSPAPKLSS